ncbi:GrpB family protein [Micromonospora sp. NPDC005203]|uniref:GrpB family protein n=1 Tax=Micromonospora sp. NPDC005203 TaxID=3364226 RepID=UPI00369E71B9
MAEHPQDVVHRFHGTPEQVDAGLVGELPRTWESIVVEEYDPAWAQRFLAVRSSLTEALGGLIISLEHVGSTAVPRLAAKPVVDVDLVIEDTGEESGYLPALERLGYRLVLREPWWHGHRMLLSPAEDVNLHVWPQGAPEPVRHRLFRNWLRAHPHDREWYAATKRRIARDTAHRPRDYSLAKNDVIDEIYARIFAASDAAAEVGQRGGTTRADG